MLRHTTLLVIFFVFFVKIEPNDAEAQANNFKICEPGYVLDKAGHFGCKPCPENTYHDQNTDECTMCPLLMYNTGSANTKCVECPPFENNDAYPKGCFIMIG